MRPLPEPSPSADIYQVDDLRIDVGRRVVSRGGAAIPVPKLSFDLLLVLIHAAPNVVSLDELMERVWPGLVVSPETVSQRVKLLRDAIGDDPRAARYIAGVRGLGYRLIRGVVVPRKPVRRPSAIALLTVAILACSALGVAVFVSNYRQPHDRVTVIGTATRTVAVLPFESLSATHENDYIAVGLSEMVLNRLSGVPSLQVVARTSSFALRGMNLEVKEIGRKLNADYLVQGSVQLSGDTLRLTAQLTDVTSGRQIKALHLDKSLQEIFSIEDEIADSVAAALALRMGDATRFRPEQARNVNLAAYLEYLQGRAALGHFKTADMRTAAAHFKHAIDIDPNFAAAYSSLADAQRWIKLNRSEFDRPAQNELQALVNKAIALDAGLGEAYVERASLGRELDGSQLDAVLALAQILNDKGDTEAARRLATGVLKLLDRMKSASPSRVFSADMYRGKAHLVLGDGEAALRDFENAVQAEFSASYIYFWSIQYDNMWDPIRAHPRFHALMSLQQTHIDRQRRLLDEMRRKGEIPARADSARLQND